LPAESGRPYRQWAERFEVDDGSGRLVVGTEPAARAPRGIVLLAPPFAEELNKCRRMCALASRALAADGWRVIRMDPYGCGDSDGDFGDATWQRWLDDLMKAVDAYADGRRLWLWGVRAGALLITPLLRARPDADVLLWQPLIEGSTVLDQFLRLRTSTAQPDAGRREDRKSLRERLARGEPLEIAGYLLGPALAQGLSDARLSLPDGYRGRVIWLDVVSAPEEPPRASARQTIDVWRTTNVQIHYSTVVGPPFWQTVEIAEAPELVERTQMLLADNTDACAQSEARPRP
jgi:exosortase A-associated hydrolase 2